MSNGFTVIDLTSSSTSLKSYTSFKLEPVVQFKIWVTNISNNMLAIEWQSHNKNDLNVISINQEFIPDWIRFVLKEAF